MSWQILIFVSVLLFSINSLFHRVLMKDEKSDPYAQTIAFYGLGGIFAFIISLFRGGFHYQISINQIPFFLLLAVFATLAPVFAFKALKLIEASENSILLSSQKLWIVILAFIFLQEPFSFKKLIGTIAILLGITVSQWRKQKMAINIGIVFVLFATVCYAVGDITAFYILRNFDAVSFTVYLCIIPVITLLLLKPDTFQKLKFYIRPKYGLNVITASINDTIATLCVYFAYQVGRNASQIAPITATQTIISVLLAIIILKERENIINKILGALVVVVGVILVL